MRLLLDTHAFLWYITDDPLPLPARADEYLRRRRREQHDIASLPFDEPSLDAAFGKYPITLFRAA